MVHPTLPPETTDRIIECLHDNRAALRACSLVWRVRAQRQIFSSIDFTTDVLVGRRYLSALDGAPHLAAHLRTVSLRLLLDGHDCTAFLAHCPLPRVTDLELTALTHGMLRNTHIPRARLGQAFPGVCRLTLAHALFPDTATMMDLLLVFPNVTDLRLSSVRVHEPVVYNAVQLDAPPLSLRALDFDDCWPSAINPWTSEAAFTLLVRQLRHLRSRNLSVYSRDEEEVAILAAFTAGTLQQLDIAVPTLYKINGLAGVYKGALGTKSAVLRSLALHMGNSDDAPGDIGRAVPFAYRIAPSDETRIVLTASKSWKAAEWTVELAPDPDMWCCTHTPDGKGPASVYEGIAVLEVLGMLEVDSDSDEEDSLSE